MNRARPPSHGHVRPPPFRTPLLAAALALAGAAACGGGNSDPPRGPVGIGQADLYATVDGGADASSTVASAADGGCQCACPEPLALPTLGDAGSGDLLVIIARERKAQELVEAALRKAEARDGKGCLADLDQADPLDRRPHHASTDPESYLYYQRGRCLMLAGQCAAGRAIVRTYMMRQTPADSAEAVADAMAARDCTGTLTERDQVLKAKHQLQEGSTNKVAPAVCRSAFDTLRRLRDKVTAKDERDQASTDPQTYVWAAAGCFARAGDCGGAFEVARLQAKEQGTRSGQPPHPQVAVSTLPDSCRGAAVPSASPRERVALAVRDFGVQKRGKPTAPACATIFDGAKTELSRLKGDRGYGDDNEADYLARSFRDEATECFVKAADCVRARQAFAEANPWVTNGTQTFERSSHAKACP